MKKIAAAMAAGCAAVVLSAVPGLAAQIPQEQHAATTDAPAALGLDAKCQVMMTARDKMAADVKAADQRLDGLVLTMNAASGTEKTTATAAVVSEMVAQRKTMRDGMMKMQENMMGHMMEHMQSVPGAMTMCPMMKGRN